MNLHSDSTDRLFEAILKLETVDECYDFFEDLCTIREIKDISQRLDVAFLLDEGKKYQEIFELTGASTSTICRVNKCYMYGNGYQNAIKKLKTTEDT